MSRQLIATLLSTTVLVGCAVRGVPDDGAGASGTGGGPASGSGGGGAEGGAGGAGGSEPVPRALPIAYVSYGSGDPDTLMVLINHADGSLVTSYLGSELPTEATVIDGDTVTYVYLSSSSTNAGQQQLIDSYRVTPELERLEVDTPLYFEPTGGVGCLSETMHVTVHVPAVTDGLTARVWFANGRASMPQTLPGDIEYDLPSCSIPGATMPVLVTVGGPVGGYVAFEMIEDVPFAVGSSVELTPTFTTMPRTTLAFDVDDVGDADTAGGRAAWYGMFDFYSDAPMFLFAPNEPGLYATIAVDGPFTLSAAPMDLPHGYVVAAAGVQFPPTASACSRSASIVRLGKSASPIPFHASELAEPLEDGASWKLGEGAIGDVLTRVASNGPTVWVSNEDPARAPIPLVFPEFPDTLPLGFTLPAGDFTVSNYSHYEDDTVSAYADAFASHKPWASTSTQRSRSRGLVCD